MSNPMTQVVTVSVIICAYTMKRWDDIRAAVDSVLIQTVPANEVLLVIDHNDELRATAEAAFAGTPVQVLANVERQGLSGARNSGVAAASGDVIAFLDDDAAAEPTWIERLSVHYADPDVYGVGGYADPVWPESRPEWMPREFDWVVGCSYIGQPTELAPVRNFIGCNMSLRRSAFTDVGGFSHAVGRIGKTPLGCEETEFCIRVKQHHERAIMLFEPQMLVHHRVSEDRVKPRYFYRRCYAEGLSKAVVSQLVGSKDGLGSERSYASRVLPAGVLRGLGDAVLRHGGGTTRSAALGRSAAIVTGLATTVAGYALGRIRIALRRGRTS